MGDSESYSRSYTEATKSALFALSAKCYHPECQQPSVIIFGDDPKKNVHIAHICALKPNGPRYSASMKRGERNNFSNLILLCEYHHGIVDKKDNESEYPVSLLHVWKRDAEKDLRSKVDGLDKLTEERLNGMLTEAAQSTKQEIKRSIDKLHDVSSGAAELLESLFDKVERHYLDEESIAILDAATHRLGHLQDGAELLSSASERVGNIQDGAELLSSASGKLGNIHEGAELLSRAADSIDTDRLFMASQRLEQFAHDYSIMLRNEPEIPDVSGAIESAGDSLMAKIDRKVKSIDLGEPQIRVDHEQRWRYAAWGFVAGAVAVLAAVVVYAILIYTGKV